MKLTKKEAKRLSLIKWDYARKTGCSLVQLKIWCENHKVLSKLHNHCGFCELVTGNCGFPECFRCPLTISWNGKLCSIDKTPYSLWLFSIKKSTRKKYAEQIYQDIKRS
jgi:hypothetical protein